MKISSVFKSLACVAIGAAAHSGCDSPEATEYYIRYTVGVNPGDVIEMEYNDNYNRKHQIEGVINDDTAVGEVGPVWGGFPASCTATVNGGEAPLYIEISYSRDGAPYETAVRATDTDRAYWHVPLEEEF